MHKSDHYGHILLKQKDKQKSSTCLNFAYKLAKLLPFSDEVIHKALVELVDEGVLKMSDNKLTQPRMVRDNMISEARSKAGKKGGQISSFAQAKRQAKIKQIPENENEYEIHFLSCNNNTDNNKGNNTGNTDTQEISTQSQITELYFIKAEEWTGVKPAYIKHGKNNHPRAFKGLADLQRPLQDYGTAIDNGFGHAEWHREKMSPAYLLEHFNELLTLHKTQRKQSGKRGFDAREAQQFIENG
jgi:hypothetical protein